MSLTVSNSTVCPNRLLLLKGTLDGEGFLVNCKRWTCEVCGQARARQFVARARRAKYDWMFTLTTGEQWTRESSKRFNERVRRLRKLFSKTIAPIEYWTWANEAGPQNEHVLHKHMLIRCGAHFLPFHAIHQLADRVGLAVWRNFKRVSSNGAASYLAKYLSKELRAMPVPRYSRRCATSVPNAPFEPKPRAPDYFFFVDSGAGSTRTPHLHHGSPQLPQSSESPSEPLYVAKPVADAALWTAKPLVTPNCLPILDSERNSGLNQESDR